MQDRDPNIVSSGLSQTVAVDGTTLKVMIYRIEEEPGWALEVLDEEGTSTVWGNVFDTDGEALQAFELTLEAEGIAAFRDRSNVIEFPQRR